MQPIPLRKGEIIIWNYGQLHGTTDNQSNQMRLMQYIRMFPAKDKYIKRDQYSSMNILKKYQKEMYDKLKNDILENKEFKNDNTTMVDHSTRLKLLGIQRWK